MCTSFGSALKKKLLAGTLVPEVSHWSIKFEIITRRKNANALDLNCSDARDFTERPFQHYFFMNILYAKLNYIIFIYLYINYIYMLYITLLEEIFPVSWDI